MCNQNFYFIFTKREKNLYIINMDAPELSCNVQGVFQGPKHPSNTGLALSYGLIFVLNT